MSMYEGEPSGGVAVHDNLYEGNVDIDTGTGRHTEMWYINGYHSTIRQNVFKHTRATGQSMAAFIWANGSVDCNQAGGNVSYANDLRIYGNTFSAESPDGIDNAVAMRGARNRVYNNLMQGSLVGGAVAIGYCEDSAVDTLFANNTVTGGPRCAQVGLFGNARNTLLANNVCPGEIYQSYNRDIGGLQVITNYTGTISGSMNVASGTMALQAGSPLIDAGTCQPAYFTDDFNGAPRPQGNACDIGALESGGGVATPAKLPVPLNFRVVLK
jgi:hypothetical protein